MARWTWLLVAALLLPGAAGAKKGFYFGFSLGGGLMFGEGAIPLKNESRDPDIAFANSVPGVTLNKSELVTTNVGSGFAANFRIGYNILGFVAIEFNAGGSGNNLTDYDKIEGQVALLGIVRFFPAQIFEDVADRWWDPYLFIGGGGYALLYNPQVEDVYPGQPDRVMQNDGRAWWPGAALTYGLGCDFYVVDFLSLGVDLAFINGFHSNFVIDNEDDVTSEPVETANTLVFQPTFKLTFHFGTD